MSDLTSKTCEACQKGAPQATPEEVEEYMKQLPDWKIEKSDGINRLKRSFKFRNFAQALSFTNQVGAIAETEQHHPAILTEWGQVTVTWWTHKIGGLHANDFIMAAKTDKLI